MEFKSLYGGHDDRSNRLAEIEALVWATLAAGSMSILGRSTDSCANDADQMMMEWRSRFRPSKTEAKR